LAASLRFEGTLSERFMWLLLLLLRLRPSLRCLRLRGSVELGLGLARVFRILATRSRRRSWASAFSIFSLGKCFSGDAGAVRVGNWTACFSNLS
jgi:hypothetical protein